MEDALDAPQGLLAPRGDAVKGFIVVFKGPTTLAGGRAGETCQVKGKTTHFSFYALESGVLPRGLTRER